MVVNLNFLYNPLKKAGSSKSKRFKTKNLRCDLKQLNVVKQSIAEKDVNYSTVTTLAKFLGWSGLIPLKIAIL